MGSSVITHSKLQNSALCFLLIAMTLAAYAPALRAGYVWDDNDYVTENPLLSEPDGLARIWFSMDAPSQYVPMVYTVLRIEYAAWGLDPFGYHLANVLLHIANALLLWRLLFRLNVPAAWAAAAVFALHPVHVESVAWISELKNVLSLFFSLGSLIAWLRFTEADPSRGRGSYFLALGCYILALFSKATASTLPAVMLLLVWLRGETLHRRRFVQVLPFLALGVGLGLEIVYWERFHIGTQGERFSLELAESVLLASRACWFYLQKLAWPTQLSFSYPRFEIDTSDPLLYGWLVAGALLLCVLWLARQRIGRAPIAAALFFIVSLSPLLGFIPLYTFWYTYVADHYQYVASIGPIALCVGGVAYGLERWQIDPRIQTALAAIVLAMLGSLVHEQAGIYENRETLWRDTIAKNPNSWMAHVNLGRHLIAEERWQDAAAAYEGALRIRPETYRAHLGRATAMRALGRDEEMVRDYESALAIEPDLPGVHSYLAKLAWRRADTEAALHHSRLMVLVAPESPHSHLLLGRGLEKIGRSAQARAEYKRALAIDPDMQEAQRGLARMRRGLPLPPPSAVAPEAPRS